jgi:hypothetical protein
MKSTIPGHFATETGSHALPKHPGSKKRRPQKGRWLKSPNRRHSGRRHYLVEQARLSDTSWMDELVASDWN